MDFILQLIFNNLEHYTKVVDDRFILSIDHDGEKFVSLPNQKKVCPLCFGNGTVLKDGLRGHAFNESDRDEMGLDFNEVMSDMRSGKYDVVCPDCKGNNVINIPDLEKATKDQLKVIESFFRILDNERLEYEAECAAERRAGC